jgi:DNA polymerase III epsilon subunit-like protein
VNYDPKTLLALDVETTGSDPAIHQILAASVVPIWDPETSCTVLVRHDALTWSETGARYFRAYRHEWERNAVTSEAAASALSTYLASLDAHGELLFVGHNVGFDLSFLKQIFRGQDIPRVSHRSIDTHTMLRVLAWLGRIPESACTSSGAFEYFGVGPAPRGRHTSLGDALATRQLFLKLVSEYDSLVRFRAISGSRF